MVTGVDELEFYAPDVATEVTLRPSRSKAFMLLFVWIAFLFGGIWMVQRGLELGWVVIPLAAGGILSSLFTLATGGASLRLSQDGFAESARLRNVLVGWHKVRDFRVVGSGSNARVEFDYVDAEPVSPGTPAEFDPLREGKGRLESNYGLQAGQLCELLVAWRRYYVR